MQLDSKKALLLMLFTIIICLNISYWLGEIEKDRYDRDYELLSYSKELIVQQDAGKAIPLLTELINRHQDDENIITTLALAQASVGDYDQSVANFQRSLEIDPNLQLLPNFNLNYSRALILNNEHEKAKELLGKISKYKKDKRFRDTYNDLYAFIQQKNN